MTTQPYDNLIWQLDGRFRELGIFSTSISNHCLKDLLNGELLMISFDNPLSLVWMPATKKPLDHLFLHTA